MPKSLHELAEQGKVGLLLKRIRQGEDINKLDTEGETPLHRAVFYRRERIVRLLLKHGADVHARGGEAGTVLQMAAWMGSVESTQLLLDHGAAADPADAQQALRNCFFDNGFRKAPLLIAAGAKIGLIEAIHQGDIVLIQNLLDEGVDPNDFAEEDYTPLLHALSNSHYKFKKLQMAGLLLDAGADINRISIGDTTALLVALGWLEADVVLYLLQRGANVNLAISTGETPLMRAIVRHSEIIPVLIEHGADVNARDKKGRSPLKIAMKLKLANKQKQLDIVNQLIQAGARR